MLGSMAQIHLVRHGQASFGAADYDQLSALGERQARLLGDWYGRCGVRIDDLHRGQLKRHRQTADGLLEGLPSALRPSSEAQVDAGFDEFDHDAMLRALRPEFAPEGAMRAWFEQQAHPARAFQQLFAEAMARWMSGAHDAEYAVSWRAFRERCVAALESACSAPAGDTIVIVTSGGPIAAICQHVLELNDEAAARLCFGLANSGVTRLQRGSARLHLGHLNSTAHLELAGDARLISYR
jgi:broad specificity phosphatase PhoE